ncbi:hypothetical protein [Streptomyces sparsogenes]|uniref:Scaffolding protein n=1 Tax=Streptomyces sparsogenes DSM 40356 TaxID=1331668 RepID=A0A1R1S855_9ACTN|nr:hypothetical protein [Streptomyces sparsogenes]OMI34378.1 hypothetical protein SPAR_36381 [Streptomyces sparsogenes DSM 40356]
MAENTTETASGTPAVPTPAEAVAAGQIPQQVQTPPAQQQEGAAQQNAGEPKQEVTDWESEAIKWKALSRQHENKHLAALGFKSKDEIDQLRAAAQKYQEFEDTQKSELQRANERAQSVEQQLSDLRATNARLMAAATHNIPPDLIDLLGAGSDEEINSRAEVLAERLKAAAPTAAPTSPRPVEALTPGAATASGTAATSPDDWIRRMAGR